MTATTHAVPTRRQAPLQALQRALDGSAYAAWVLGLVLSWELWLLCLLFWPAGDGPLAAFAAEFRAWCFGADADTGGVGIVQAIAMLTSPLLMVVVVLAVWGRALRTAWQDARRRLLLHGGASVIASAASAGLLMATTELPAPAGAAFPADALRTAVPAPELRLLGHDGTAFDLAAERGRVVLLTAVYSSCGYACPGLMNEVTSTLAALTDAERDRLRIGLITLDPVRDTTGVLATVAQARGFVPPTTRMLTGEPSLVERTLDRLGFERRRDPQTGVIDHANLFVLVDPQGRIAYRLGAAGKADPADQGRAAPSPTAGWLLAAVRTLLRETGGQ